MLDSLAVIVRRRKMLLGAVLTGLLIGLLIAVFTPARYTTSFSFVSQAEGDVSRSTLAGLAGQFGVSLGSATGQSASPQLYADLLVTREILSAIASDSVPSEGGGSIPLATVLRVRTKDVDDRTFETIRKLKDDVISASVSKTTGVVSVEVRTRSARASLAIAERLLDGLNHFNVATRQSQAVAERKFVEARLDDAKRELAAHEERLRGFLEGNRSMANSPALQFEQERLRRDVSIEEQLVRTLTQQFDEARIREVRDTPVITLIERPVLAVRADPRGRVRIVLGAISTALIMTACVLLIAERFRREFDAYGADSFASLARRSERTRQPA